MTTLNSSTISENLRTVHCPICGPESSCSVKFKEKLEFDHVEFTARRTPDGLRFRIVTCDTCGLVYVNPAPTHELVEQMYFDGGFIDEPQLENMHADYLDEIEKVIGLIQRGRMLEIGCSNGGLIERAKERFGFKEVWGIEPCAASVEHSSESVRPYIIQDVLKEGMFPPDHFDLIVFFQVFDHITAPNEFLKTVHHYLKPGGIVLALNHNIKALMPTILQSKAPTYDIQHMFLWDKKTMRMILNKNGFIVRSIKGSWNKYYIDHVIRMLPLPASVKDASRNLLGQLGLKKLSIKACVENMVAIATK